MSSFLAKPHSKPPFEGLFAARGARYEDDVFFISEDRPLDSFEGPAAAKSVEGLFGRVACPRAGLFGGGQGGRAYMRIHATRLQPVVEVHGDRRLQATLPKEYRRMHGSE